MLNGSCACGQIRYEIRGELVGTVHHCHCWRCRKHSGASFGTTSDVRASEFFVVSGEDLLSEWESSPGFHRFFAGCCGSPIFKREDEAPEVLGFRLGTLDTDPGRLVEEHFSVTSKVPWIEIDDGLRQTPDGPPFPERD